MHTQIQQIKSAISTLSNKNDSLENRSRRNNIILHGLSEGPGENREELSAIISKWFDDTLKVACPRIERCHRLGSNVRGRPRPVIMKLLDFQDKVVMLKNCYKLKNTGFRVSEDFSPQVRNIRKRLWEASACYRDNGASVQIRFDHVFIDKVRYDWDSSSNTLVRSSTGLAKPAESTSGETSS